MENKMPQISKWEGLRMYSIYYILYYLNVSMQAFYLFICSFIFFYFFCGYVSSFPHVTTCTPLPSAITFSEREKIKFEDRFLRQEEVIWFSSPHGSPSGV